MGRWIDNLPNKWYYNEMVEAGDIYLEDGEPFVAGMPYNVFEPNAPFIYVEVKALAGQHTFTIDKVIEPSSNNPLYVYVNSIQTVYKEVVKDGTNTKISLFQGVEEGTIVTFASYGIAKVDNNGRPFLNANNLQYPNYTLKGASSYVFDNYNSQFTEYVYAFGKQLKRARISNEEWVGASGNIQKVLRKYIKSNADTYVVSADGVIHLPYNLNNVTCKIIYTTNEGYNKKNTEEFVPTSPSVSFLNRLFPESKMTRAEGFVLLDRLRSSFYSRFTDIKAPTHNLSTEVNAYNGQRLVSISGSYVVGSGELKVWLNGIEQQVGRDYDETSPYTITFVDFLNDGDIVKFSANRTVSIKLKDVGTTTNYTRSDTGETFTLNGTIGNDNPEDDSWWAPNILALEQEFLSSGENMVEGVPVTANGLSIVVNGNMQAQDGPDLWFMPNSFMTRAAAVTIINRFRKLCLEKFL